MTGTLAHLASATSARRLEIADLIDGLVHSMSRSDSDVEDAQLLAELAEATDDLATLTGLVEDADDTRMIVLLADLAAARAHDRPRAPGLLPELEQQPYQRAVMACMASRVVDQPGWVLAVRLNALIDRAIDLGIGTRLTERLALAVSRRPDGENAVEHDEADGIGVGVGDELGAPA
ncbi:hypothetical protein BS329_15525 [Amycolatopsis coloradensis]|uniref:Uncharacterized protein n=1 Tax=Amycolatopsis coloradensis TaxID=76021 RepID=A0A1R0KU67_9PSEU|nr:hypothetical protein [Amycolatopsis coloradensis]OLZ51673.1 hypothetical protein BS329_15525 [Amycolatopsis coloradensis]